MGAAIKFLPPYSPDLMPIEEAWSKVKQMMRASKPRTEDAIDAAFLPPQLLDPNGVYRVESRPDGWWALRENGALAYRFERRARRLSEFEPGKVFHTTSPLSHFTRAPLITLPTERGRVTLRGGERIETVDGVKTTTQLRAEDWPPPLRDLFGFREP